MTIANQKTEQPGDSASLKRQIPSIFERELAAIRQGVAAAQNLSSEDRELAGLDEKTLSLILANVHRAARQRTAQEVRRRRAIATAERAGSIRRAPHDMNTLAAKVWSERNSEFLRRILKYPASLKEGVEKQGDLEAAIRYLAQAFPRAIDDSSLPLFNAYRAATGHADLYTHMKRAEERIIEEQANRAKKPRPKKNPTHRAEFVAAMRMSRTKSVTLAEFLGAVRAKTVLGLSMGSATEPDRFIVTCDVLPGKGKTVGHSTLESWWTESIK